MDLLRKMLSLTGVIHQIYLSVQWMYSRSTLSWLLGSDRFINSGIE